MTHLTLQLDEEGDARERFHSQRVTQIGVTADLTQAESTYKTLWAFRYQTSLVSLKKWIKFRISNRIHTIRSYLQEEADNVSNMWDDNGHLTLHELIKHLHGLTGLVLWRERQK